MARLELHDAEGGSAQGVASSDVFFRLAMNYATGRTVAPDLVSAHKWFNIAALKGHREASRYRSEIALEMQDEQIAEAQRAAREWLRLN